MRPARPFRSSGAFPRATAILTAAILTAMSVPTVPSTASAADLGVRGQTWPVAEPDLLVEIEARLAGMERSGELARIEAQARARAGARLEEPDPVAGIAPARERRSRLFDPAIVVDRDIRSAGRHPHRGGRHAYRPAGRHDARPRSPVHRRTAQGRNRLGARARGSREDRPARRAAARPRPRRRTSLLLRPGRASRGPVRAHCNAEPGRAGGIEAPHHRDPARGREEP